MMNKERKKLIDSIAISATAKFDIDQFLNNDKTISQYASLVLEKTIFSLHANQVSKRGQTKKIVLYY